MPAVRRAAAGLGFTGGCAGFARLVSPLVLRSCAGGLPRVGPAAHAVVALTGGFHYAGNCVYLDLGQGLVSMYFHLSEPQGAPGGQREERGQQHAFAAAFSSFQPGAAGGPGAPLSV